MFTDSNISDAAALIERNPKAAMTLLNRACKSLRMGFDVNTDSAAIIPDFQALGQGAVNACGPVLEGLLADEDTFQPAMRTVLVMIRQMMTGDYGTVCAEDAAANRAALVSGDRLVARYVTAYGEFYVIAEHAESHLGHLDSARFAAGQPAFVKASNTPAVNVRCRQFSICAVSDY